MNFFDIGLQEIFVIILVALIAFGPGRMAETARKLGKGMQTLRKATQKIKEEVSKEFDLQDEEAAKSKADNDKRDGRK